MKKQLFLLLLFAFSFTIVSSALYANGTSAPSVKNSDSEYGMHPGLDYDTRKNRPRLIEFNPFGGSYVGSYLNSSYVVGGRLAFRVTNRFQIGGEFNYSNLRYDLNSNFAQSGVRTRNQYIGDLYMTYNVPVLQRPFSKIQEIDLFTTIGIGDNYINKKHRITGVVGGGVRLFTSVPWLAIRVDVNTYIYSLPRLNNSKIASDWTSTVGPSFLFIPKDS